MYSPINVEVVSLKYLNWGFYYSCSTARWGQKFWVFKIDDNRVLNIPSPEELQRIQFIYRIIIGFIGQWSFVASTFCSSSLEHHSCWTVCPLPDEEVSLVLHFSPLLWSDLLSYLTLHSVKQLTVIACPSCISIFRLTIHHCVWQSDGLLPLGSPARATGKRESHPTVNRPGQIQIQRQTNKQEVGVQGA